MAKKMTFDQAKSFCKKLGFSLFKRDEEFLLYPFRYKKDSEETYYTPNIDDAVETARAAKRLSRAF